MTPSCCCMLLKQLSLITFIKVKPLPLNLKVIKLNLLNHVLVGRDSSVGIATRYGLDGPGIESRCGRDFSHSYRPALRPTQPPIQWVPGLFPGSKAGGAWS
jgi:hypothetical protein